MTTSHNKYRFVNGLFFFFILSSAASAQSGWTQWGGPHRNFTVDAKGLATSWPTGGPHQLWKRELGEGYSPIAADGGKLYTMYQRGGQEVVIALDAASGRTLWEYAYQAPITANMSNAPGPRATPLLLGNLIYTTGATGKLHCLDALTGKVVWAHDLFNEYKGYVQDEYYASSPLAYKNTIIVPVGATGASVMAFNQKDGAVVWKKLDFKTSYASPILITVDGQDQAVLMMESEVIGIDPNNGDLLWSYPHKNRTKTNVSTPVWGEDHLLFCSSAYDSGSRALKLTREGGTTKVEEIWFQKQMRVHIGNVIRLGDIVYGSSGDFSTTSFTALNVKTGQVLWHDQNISKVAFISVGGQFILLNEDGELILATPTAEGLKVHAKAELLTRTSWTPPTLTGTKLYLRDRKSLLALDLK